MDDAFRVTFGCTNCGKEWPETYPPRWFVGKSHRGDRVRAYDKDCNEMMNSCDTCGPIRCPTCELFDPVEVRDREPLDDDVEEEADNGGEAAA